MKGSHTLLAIVAAAGLLGVGSGCGGGSRSGGSPPVLLLTLAPTQTTYASGEAVRLEVTLENVSTAPVAVSPLWEAVLRVDSFTRDGLPLAASTVDALFEESFEASQAADLRTLAPGEELKGMFESGPGGPALMNAFRFTGAGSEGVGTVTSWDVSAPGVYALSVRYSYTGTVPPGEPVHVGPTAPATITFTGLE